MSPLRVEKHQNHPSSPSMTEQPLHLLLAMLAVTTMRPVNCHRIVVYLRAAISEKWHVMVCRTVILVVVFSQFLRGLQVNFCVRIDGRWEERGFPFFGVFAVRHVTSCARRPCALAVNIRLRIAECQLSLVSTLTRPNRYDSNAVRTSDMK